MPHKNPKARAAYLKAYNAARKAQARTWRLMAKYSLAPEDFDRMLEAQGGKCAICGTSDPGRWDFLYVDHDHATGRVRGLLCSRCNRGIGLFGDSPGLLERAAHYLAPKKAA